MELLQGKLWPSASELLYFNSQFPMRRDRGYDAWLYDKFSQLIGSENIGVNDVAKAAKKNGGFTWKGYVDHKLTSDEKEQFSSWDCEGEHVFNLLAEVVQEGYRLNWSFQDKRGTFDVTLTGVTCLPEHVGYTLTAFGKDYYQALRALLFKHVILFADGWPVGEAAGGESDLFG